MVDDPATGQIDAMIRSTGGWRGEMLCVLRQHMAGAVPGVVEEVKWKKPSRPEGVPVWSLDGIVCTADVLKQAVRLTFPKGARMEDPAHLFNARLTGGTVRAIDFGEGDTVDGAALRALVVEAVKLNAAARPAPRRNRTRGPAVAAAVDVSSRGALRRTDGEAASRSRHRGAAARSGRVPSSRSGPVPGGVVHELPADLHAMLIANRSALDAWIDITPLARNEFICWIEDAKQPTTRQRRIQRTAEELQEGQRRPCCWPGCRHRERTGR